MSSVDEYKEVKSLDKCVACRGGSCASHKFVSCSAMEIQTWSFAKPAGHEGPYFRMEACGVGMSKFIARLACEESYPSTVVLEYTGVRYQRQMQLMIANELGARKVGILTYNHEQIRFAINGEVRAVLFNRELNDTEIVIGVVLGNFLNRTRRGIGKTW